MIRRKANKSKEIKGSSVLILHCDCFGLQVLVQRVFAEVLAKAALLETAERCGDVGLVIAVDEAGAGLDAFAKLHCLVNVVRENARCQAVVVVVRTTYDLLKMSEFRNAHHRSERLLFCQVRVILHAGEDRRLEKVTWPGHELATINEFCSFFLADIDVLEQLVQMSLVILRAVCSGAVQRIANLHFAGLVYQALHELVVNVFLNENSAGSNTILTCFGKMFNKIKTGS